MFSVAEGRCFWWRDHYVQVTEARAHGNSEKNIMCVKGMKELSVWEGRLGWSDRLRVWPLNSSGDGSPSRRLRRITGVL